MCLIFPTISSKIKVNWNTWIYSEYGTYGQFQGKYDKIRITRLTGYMEVKVENKKEVHIYIVWALQYMYDNLL